MRRAPRDDEAAGIPVVLQHGLAVLLVGGGVVSVFFIGEYSPLPITAALDAWMICLAGWILMRGRIVSHATLGVVLMLAAVRLGPALLLVHPPLVDLLQAHRWLFYLAVMALVRGHRWTRPHLLVGITWWLVGLAALKAVVTRLVVGPESRPGLFLENNFELALFCGLAAVVHRRAGRGSAPLILMLGLLTVLAGSRSGAVAYLILVLHVLWTARVADVFLRQLTLLGPLLAALIPLAVFRMRAAEAEVIDRVRFADVLLDEAGDWSVTRWLVGPPPITPLSEESCQRLSYYEALFSTAGDGTCYAVILHAFVLRIVYDAGLLGLLLAFGIPLLLMLRSGAAVGPILVVTALAAVNSLSVSGLNNPYVALPILVVLLTAPAAATFPGDDRDDRVARAGRADAASGGRAGRPRPVRTAAERRTG